VQKNTAYGVFVQACWAQHKRQYPDELIHKEIEEFNKQCSVWWYNLSEQERERFQEMADRSNAQQAALNQAYSAQVQQQQQQAATTVQTAGSGTQQLLVTNAASGSTGQQQGIPSFGSSFSYSDYGIQGAGGQVVNAVVDNAGQVLNYSTNAGSVQQVRQVVTQQAGGNQATKVVVGAPGNMANASMVKPNQKPMKDPNAPKKTSECVLLVQSGGEVKSEE